MGCRFVLCPARTVFYYTDPGSQLILLSLRRKMFCNQLAFPYAQDEVCLFTGSRSAALRMTCCVRILPRSRRVMRAPSWTSSIWPCGTSMAWRRLTELWEYPSWSARCAPREAGGAERSHGHEAVHFLLFTEILQSPV